MTIAENYEIKNFLNLVRDAVDSLRPASAERHGNTLVPQAQMSPMELIARQDILTAIDEGYLVEDTRQHVHLPRFVRKQLKTSIINGDWA